jgi:hypothetical protein
MCKVEEYMQWSLRSLSRMLAELDLAVCVLLERVLGVDDADEDTPEQPGQISTVRLKDGNSGGAGDSAAGSTSGDRRTATCVDQSPSQADLQAALRLASLSSTVPWDQIDDAAHNSRIWNKTSNWTEADSKFVTQLFVVQCQLCAIPLLRDVCMLAIVGRVDVSQKQGVLALLGGVLGEGDASIASDASSHVASSLPLPEPAELAEFRQEHSLSLADMSLALVCYDSSGKAGIDSDDSDDDEDGDSWDQASSLIKHLLAVFTREQLPCIAHMHNVLEAAGLEGNITDEELGVRSDMYDLWSEDDISDIYLSWVQASLLKVIREVLHEAGVRG